MAALARKRGEEGLDSGGLTDLLGGERDRMQEASPDAFGAITGHARRQPRRLDRRRHGAPRRRSPRQPLRQALTRPADVRRPRAARPACLILGAHERTPAAPGSTCACSGAPGCSPSCGRRCSAWSRCCVRWPPAARPPWLRLSVTLAIGLGVAGSAVLASLKTRGQAAVLAFYAFLVLALDALGQVVAPARLADLAADGAAGGRAWRSRTGSSTRSASRRSRRSWPRPTRPPRRFTTWKAVLAGGFGYLALAFAIHHALLFEKRRLASLRAELARLTSGIDQLDERRPTPLPLTARAGGPAARVGGRAPRAPARPRRGAGRGARAAGRGGALRHRRALGPVLRPRPRPRLRGPALLRLRGGAARSRRWSRSRRTRSPSCSTASSPSTRPTSSGCSGRCRTTAARCGSARCWRCRC